MMTVDNSWEDKIYSKNKHLNKYPYGELVSIFFNSLKFIDIDVNNDNGKIKILELGSGAGNNLWFFSELGFDTYGLDGSKSACEHAKRLLNTKKLQATIINGTFDSLPFENQYFDVIIDRCATCCGTIEDIQIWWTEANRVLKKNGLVISFRYSDKGPDLKLIIDGKMKAIKLDDYSYKDLEYGTFCDTGVINFCSYDNIFKLFNFIDIKFVNQHSSITVFDKVDNQYNYDEWIIVGTKK